MSLVGRISQDYVVDPLAEGMWDCMQLLRRPFGNADILKVHTRCTLNRRRGKVTHSLRHTTVNERVSMELVSLDAFVQASSVVELNAKKKWRDHERIILNTAYMCICFEA